MKNAKFSILAVLVLMGCSNPPEAPPPEETKVEETKPAEQAVAVAEEKPSVNRISPETREFLKELREYQQEKERKAEARAKAAAAEPTFDQCRERIMQQFTGCGWRCIHRGGSTGRCVHACKYLLSKKGKQCLHLYGPGFNR